MNYKIYLSPPKQGKDDLDYINSAITDVKINPNDGVSREFENSIEDYLGCSNLRNIVAVNSGTSALHLSLLLLKVKAGDIIFCQSSTFIASVNPVLYEKAIPVFIDSEESTWNMCPILLEKAIKELARDNLKPKAVIVACSYGMPCKYSEISEVLRTYGIPLIEDSAAALGSLYRGIPCGAFGDFSIFSFNVNKIITGFSGGTLSVKNKNLSDRGRNLISQGKIGMEIGYNYKMSSIVAAVASSQLKDLDTRVYRKREVYNNYYSQLKELKGVSFLEEPTGFFSNRWLSTLLFESKLMKNSIKNSLTENGIETRDLWEPLHVMKKFKGFKFFYNGVSEDLYSRGLCLPSSVDLLEDQEIIINIIRKCLKSIETC